MKEIIIVIHRCIKSDCRCNDRAGIIAYRGTDESEAAKHMANAPSGYEAVRETRPKRRRKGARRSVR